MPTSGIRPLPASEPTAPGLISRDHSAPVSEPAGDRPFPIISLVGGKWTTFRGFAEEVADAVLVRLGRVRTTSTRTLAIGGGRGFPADPAARSRWVTDAARQTGLSAARMEEFLSRYGTTALAVAGHRGAWSDTDRLSDARSYSLSEIDWIARNETVVHLADIVMRRTTLAITGSLSTRDLDAIAAVAADALGWEDAQGAREIAAATAELAGNHQMRFGPDVNQR